MSLSGEGIGLLIASVKSNAVARTTAIPATPSSAAVPVIVPVILTNSTFTGSDSINITDASGTRFIANVTSPAAPMVVLSSIDPSGSHYYFTVKTGSNSLLVSGVTGLTSIPVHYGAHVLKVGKVWKCIEYYPIEVIT